MTARRKAGPPLPKHAVEAWLQLLTCPELQPAAAGPPPEALPWALEKATLVLPVTGRVPFREQIYPYQQAILEDRAERRIILKARQTGVSNVCAIEALWGALVFENLTTLFVSKNQDAAQELVRYCQNTLTGLTGPLPRLVTENQGELAWENGSRIVSLPSTPSTGRGIAAQRVYLDEFAFAAYDQLVYDAIVPTLSHGGQLTVLSTPNGRANLFYRLWEDLEGGDWSKHEIRWDQCPRYTEAWATRTRTGMSAQAFAQEYDCHATDTLVRRADGQTVPITELRTGDTLLTWQHGALGLCTVRVSRATGVKPMVVVTDELGRQVRASAKHAFRVNGEKVRLQDATSLDIVPLPRPAPTRQQALARVVAFNLGDGTIARRANGQMIASFYAKRAEDLWPLTEDLVTAGIVDRQPSILFKRGRVLTSDGYQVHVGHRGAQKLVAAGAVVGSKVAQAFPVPRWLDESTAPEFLAALWGAEGSAPAQASGRAKACTQLQLSQWKAARADGEHYFAVLAAWHRQCGIDCTVTVGQHGDRWRFTLNMGTSKANVRRFFARVGYCYAAAKAERAFLWDAYYAAWQYAAVTQRVARGTVTEPQPPRSYPRFDAWFARRWDGGRLRARVVDVAPSPDQYTWNIQVDSADHSYLLADGTDNFNCDFIASGDAVFKPEDLRRCRQGYDPVPTGGRTITAWDIGRRQDHTVGITLEEKGEAWHVVAYERFMAAFPQIQAHIEVRHDRFPAAEEWVESNGIGDPVIENLRPDVKISINRFTTTQNSKIQAIQALQLLIEQGRFKHAEPQMDRELGLYQWEDRKLVQDTVITAAIAAKAAVKPAIPVQVFF